MVTIKTKEEIDIIRVGGHKLAAILKALVAMVKPGVSTAEIEDLCCELIEKAGGRPSFKDYPMGANVYFPTAVCASINNEVVHGPAVPGRILKAGDIIDLDIGMEYPAKNGLFTDMCVTVPVGKVSKEATKLMKVSRDCLTAAIKKVKAGATLNDIGKAVESLADKYNYGVVRDLVGHGVGYKAHEEPNVFNYEIGDNSSENMTLKEGMVLAIEPMINMGTWKVKTAPDRMTVITADGSLSAHFEHTVVVTKNGCEVLTI
ncbi:MAG: type I methionyl aminopeptidase [Candidatus Falkowbacteria bacterium]